MASSIDRYFMLVLAIGETVLFWIELDDKVSCAVIFAFIGSDCLFYVSFNGT